MARARHFERDRWDRSIERWCALWRCRPAADGRRGVVDDAYVDWLRAVEVVEARDGVGDRVVGAADQFDVEIDVLHADHECAHCRRLASSSQRLNDAAVWLSVRQIVVWLLLSSRGCRCSSARLSASVSSSKIEYRSSAGD
jgi:hypothetical protein